MVFGLNEPTGRSEPGHDRAPPVDGGLVEPVPYDSVRVSASSQANWQRGEPSKGES